MVMLLLELEVMISIPKLNLMLDPLYEFWVGNFNWKEVDIGNWVVILSWLKLVHEIN